MAYEKDIATAHFYFGTPTITEFRRMETMTATGFLSQVSHSHNKPVHLTLYTQYGKSGAGMISKFWDI